MDGKYCIVYIYSYNKSQNQTCVCHHRALPLFDSICHQVMPIEAPLTPIASAVRILYHNIKVAYSSHNLLGVPCLIQSIKYTCLQFLPFYFQTPAVPAASDAVQSVISHVSIQIVPQICELFWKIGYLAITNHFHLATVGASPRFRIERKEKGVLVGR